LTDISKLKNFSENKLKKADRWLTKSYKAASALQPPVSLEELKEINSRIIAKFQNSAPKESKSPEKSGKQTKQSKQEKPENSRYPEESFEEKLRTLYLKLDKKISNSLETPESRRTRLPALKKSAEILNSFTMQNYNQNKTYSIEDILEIIEKITDLEYSKKLLHCSGIIRILKYFKSFLADSSDQEVKKLVKLSDKLLQHFNKLLVMSELFEGNSKNDENHSEKVKMRGEMLKVLSDKGFSGASGSKQMKNIESKLKEMDPSEGKVYLEKYSYLIKEFQRSTSLSLEDLTQQGFVFLNNS
jgi:hypothetical protein